MPKKNSIFTKEDYFTMLDKMLTMPEIPAQPNPLVEKLRQAIEKRKTAIPRM